MTIEGGNASGKYPSGGAVPPDGAFLRVKNLSKSFFGVTVLDHVTLTVESGRVHALLGENGAGKSTLINLLSGVHRPDSGSILIEGRPVRFSGPNDAQKRGITTIHQEFSLFPDLTVAETIFAGHLPLNRFGIVDWNAIARRAHDVLRQLGVAINPRRRVASLSVAEQQLVEIARALTLNSRLIIMDEPTASLTPQEVGHLKNVIRSVVSEGVAIVFVSHRLEEVKELAETYTILRDGRIVAEGDVKDASIDDLVRSMVGRAIDLKQRDARARQPGSTVLKVENSFQQGRFRPRDCGSARELLGTGRRDRRPCRAGRSRPHGNRPPDLRRRSCRRRLHPA